MRGFSLRGVGPRWYSQQTVQANKKRHVVAVDVPEQLHRSLKAKAAMNGESFKALVVRALSRANGCKKGRG